MTTGEMLLARLSMHFQQDPFIDEIGLLFDIEQSDVTPDTAFSLENHKLGVAFTASCIQEAVEMTHSEDNGCRAQLLHCTRAILLISADFYTAWNTRKSFVTRGWLDAQDEVQFTNLVFTLHPKSIDTWAYRRWLAIRLCQSLSEDELRMFSEQQIEISSRLAELKPQNYHAWSFRHWIVSRLPLDLMLKELNTMECWCKTHVTDYSGWNHRQHILNELAKKYQDAGGVAGSLQNLVLAEFKFLSEVMATYSTYEALWCHRRYVMQRLLKQMSRRANSDLSLVPVLVSQVTKTLLDTKQEFFGAAALKLSWGETIKVFLGIMPLGVLLDFVYSFEIDILD
ncbi:unnamed protein product [Peronospora destructor]|uniref:Uncharacterized protein n=1 Tax=Peronospora destructor TaxID=86335 RepID=A0AAV0U3A9_9STRA|nr:unnamed protein product [Peronospora destructor]